MPRVATDQSLIVMDNWTLTHASDILIGLYMTQRIVRAAGLEDVPE